MIGIKGPRGSGKTTLILQYMKYDLKELAPRALYITADHTWFYNHTLLDTAMDWYRQGGRILLIDEVHKYPQWSRELKNIYDGLPEMRVVFSASSALDIYRGEADLSRRAISYSLAGLSFREYLTFAQGVAFDPLTIEDIKITSQRFQPVSIGKITTAASLPKIPQERLLANHRRRRGRVFAKAGTGDKCHSRY